MNFTAYFPGAWKKLNLPQLQVPERSRWKLSSAATMAKADFSGAVKVDAGPTFSHSSCQSRVTAIWHRCNTALAWRRTLGLVIVIARDAPVK